MHVNNLQGITSNRATPARTAIYARVSTRNQHPEAQEKPCRDEAARRDWGDVPDAVFYTDDGISGRLRDRPALDRLLSDIDSGRVTHLLFDKLDRIVRSVPRLAGLFEKFDAAGVKVAAVSDPVDTSTAARRFLVTLLGAVAELEVDLGHDIDIYHEDAATHRDDALA